MQMKKEKKNHKIIKITVMLIVIAVIILLLVFSKDIMKLTTKNEINLAQNIENNMIMGNPNAPTISSGMIPVKWDEGTEMWVITTEADENWYNYEQGKPAYMMLNDGVYQSELMNDMTGKKLAEENIGAQIQENEIGTIFAWIPRFAVNNNTQEMRYVTNKATLETMWMVPDTFKYEIDNETLPDFSLTGVWIEKNIDEKYVSNIEEMNKEQGKYEFLANTKAMQITGDDITYISNITICEAITDISNQKRIILKVIDTDERELIKAKATYNSNERKIEIEVKYSENEIAMIQDEDGNILSRESRIADTGDKTIRNQTYKFLITDVKNNSIMIKIKVIEAKSLVIYNLENLVSSNTNNLVDYDGTYTTTLTPINSLNYQRPTTIEITMDGVLLTSEYTYNSVSGVLTVNHVTGTLVINASAIKISGNISFSSAADATDGGTYSASLTQSYQLRVFKFTPTTTATYKFYSADSVADTKETDPYAYLYSTEKYTVEQLDQMALEYAQTGKTDGLSSKSLKYDDDGGNGYNFSFTYSCKAGVTYYLAIRTYTPDKVQSFSPIYIVKN